MDIFIKYIANAEGINEKDVSLEIQGRYTFTSLPSNCMVKASYLIHKDEVEIGIMNVNTITGEFDVDER